MDDYPQLDVMRREWARRIDHYATLARIADEQATAAHKRVEETGDRAPYQAARKAARGAWWLWNEEIRLANAAIKAETERLQLGTHNQIAAVLAR